MPNTFVTALRPEPSIGRPFSFVSARLHTLTNERGEFRLDGLNLGEFYVVALPHNSPLDAFHQLNRSGYANTFYPNAPSPAEAKLVQVTASGPAVANITLRPAALRTISGVVITAAGQPATGGTVGLSHGDGLFGLDGRGVVIGSDGRFVAPALPPGTYFLLFDEGPWPPPRGTIPKVSRARVTLAGTDVPGVRVLPLEMVHASGHVVISSIDRASLDPSTIHLSALPYPPDGNPGPQQGGDLKADLSFEFRTWPGPGRIRVSISSPSWVVKAIRLNGAEVMDKTVNFVQGQEMSGLEVELVKRG